MTAPQRGQRGLPAAMTVAKRVGHLITTESEASIGSLSLLGEPVVDLSAAASGTPLGDGVFVRADHTGGISALATRGFAKISGREAASAPGCSPGEDARTRPGRYSTTHCGDDPVTMFFLFPAQGPVDLAAGATGCVD
jgi:hypothetical protein